MGEFKSIVARAVCVVVIALAGSFYAGDVVGVMRVDIATNGLVEVEMPFEPMGNTGPSGFISLRGSDPRILITWVVGVDVSAWSSLCGVD